ncbi:MAG: hypothetical protein IS860_08490 [Nitrosopumilus sp.]|nr:hypothetical protein [Nitrosopumilus sp.]MCE2507376.1 hypothetical protein [Nitrosopumilaceae archaeon]
MTSDHSKTDSTDELSVCETMKEDVSEVFRKMESHASLAFQTYSNLYTQYLHVLDDVFGTGFISEKKFFDKLNIDPQITDQMKKNSEFLKKIYLQNIDMSSMLLEKYGKIRLDTLKMYDNYVHDMMTVYSNTLSQFKKSD